MWSLIRKNTISSPFLSYYAGKFMIAFLSIWQVSCFSMIIILFTFSDLRFIFHYSDWNGSKRGHVYKFLRSQGFVSSYDTAHQYTDADAHKVILMFMQQVLFHFI